MITGTPLIFVKKSIIEPNNRKVYLMPSSEKQDANIILLKNNGQYYYDYELQNIIKYLIMNDIVVHIQDKLHIVKIDVNTYSINEIKYTIETMGLDKSMKNTFINNRKNKRLITSEDDFYRIEENTEFYELIKRCIQYVNEFGTVSIKYENINYIMTIEYGESQGHNRYYIADDKIKYELGIIFI